MRSFLRCTLLAIILLPSSLYAQEKYTNALINESSPYLLQHAHNPVNWHPWGDEALKKAQDENKLIVVSIGYAACHWCHVMEHESFEDTAVARIMNEHFVCIKVDREERPDVDQLYMSVAQLINGNGGWPLNALALPDGKPFYAGTYFPKDDWVKLLDYVIKTNKKTPDVLVQNAENITEGIRSLEIINQVKEKPDFHLSELAACFDSISPKLDDDFGGKLGAPKFPLPTVWEYLLHYGEMGGNRLASRASLNTLRSMAFGGIYDHIGGGFSRYSTDDRWKVPHFEKMLYDNAQLVSLYSHGWQKEKDTLFKNVVYETLDFIRRDMTHKKGGFYSSFDADSEGEEGKYYVWSEEEITELLGKNAGAFMGYYNCRKGGNWEHGKNILHRWIDDKGYALTLQIPKQQLRSIIREGKEILLKEREKRIPPALDNKIIASWNGLMLKGYATAYRVFGEKKFLKAAKKNGQFLRKKAITEEGEIMRDCKGKKSKINGFLDDYAFTISAFIEMYQATLNEKWLHEANDLTRYTIAHFSDTSSGMFFYTNNQLPQLVSRKIEVYDNVIPSSNSEMALNLYYLGHYFYNKSYLERAKQMLANVEADMKRDIAFYSNWGRLHAHFASEPFEIAIVGKKFLPIRKGFDNDYFPNILFLGGKKGTLELLEGKMVKGQTTVYVCKGKVCQMPITTFEDALRAYYEF